MHTKTFDESLMPSGLLLWLSLAGEYRNNITMVALLHLSCYLGAIMNPLGGRPCHTLVNARQTNCHLMQALQAPVAFWTNVLTLCYTSVWNAQENVPELLLLDFTAKTLTSGQRLFFWEGGGVQVSATMQIVRCKWLNGNIVDDGSNVTSV